MKKLIVLLAMATSFSAMAADLSCGGTEPFWDLEIKGNTVIYNSFFEDDSTTREAIISKTDGAGLAPDFAYVVKTANATATIITGECSDGMSDTVYEKHIMYTTATSVLYGCCNPAK